MPAQEPRLVPGSSPATPAAGRVWASFALPTDSFSNLRSGVFHPLPPHTQTPPTVTLPKPQAAAPWPPSASDADPLLLGSPHIPSPDPCPSGSTSHTTHEKSYTEAHRSFQASCTGPRHNFLNERSPNTLPNRPYSSSENLPVRPTRPPHSPL